MAKSKEQYSVNGSEIVKGRRTKSNFRLSFVSTEIPFFHSQHPSCAQRVFFWPSWHFSDFSSVMRNAMDSRRTTEILQSNKHRSIRSLVLVSESFVWSIRLLMMSLQCKMGKPSSISLQFLLRVRSMSFNRLDRWGTSPCFRCISSEKMTDSIFLGRTSFTLAEKYAWFNYGFILLGICCHSNYLFVGCWPNRAETFSCASDIRFIGSDHGNTDLCGFSPVAGHHATSSRRCSSSKHQKRSTRASIVR